MILKNFIQSRYILALFMFFVLMEMYCQIAVINMAILSMVNQTALLNNQNETFSEECPNKFQQSNTSNYKEGSYVWSQSTQGIILGSYFYGNVFSQFTSGSVIFLVGSKKALILSTSVSAVFTLLTPYAASFGVVVISLVQTTIGLFHGFSFLAIFTLLGRWSPEKEKSSLTSVTYCGVQVGTFTGMMLTGYLCAYEFFGGWPSSFYVIGTAGLVLAIFLLFMIYERPEDHPRISEKELKFLKENILNISSHEKKLNVPWKSILTSRSIWITSLTRICWGYNYYTLISKLPSYFRIVLHFPMQQNGVVNALIYSADALTIFLSGFMADYIRKRNYFSLTTTRKIFEAIGMFGPALCILLVPFLGCDSTKVIIAFVFTLLCFGFNAAGDIAIVMDLAPDFAGILYGFTNAFGNLPAIISPYIAGLLLDKDQGSMVQWSYIFYIVSGFYFIGGIIFLLGASAEIEPWAVVKATSKEENKY